MKYAILSDRGLVRSKNEDHYLTDEQRGLFIVCDGMGGHKGGEVASAVAIEVISRHMPAGGKNKQTIESLNEAVAEANLVILDKSVNNQELNGMGTTVTAAIIKEKSLWVAHVGDSSLFVISNNSIKKITRDHTLAEQMVLENILPVAEAAKSPYNHVLTRALGLKNQVEIDNYEEYIQSGDLVLLCSDGLTDLLNYDEILTLAQKEKSLDKSAKALVSLALDRGGNDNVTVILISI